jgi:hypothetical protein
MTTVYLKRGCLKHKHVMFAKMRGLAVQRQLRRIKLEWTRMCGHIVYVLTKMGKESDLLILTCLLKCVDAISDINDQVKVIKRKNGKACEADCKILRYLVDMFSGLTEEMDSNFQQSSGSAHERVRRVLAGLR